MYERLYKYKECIKIGVVLILSKRGYVYAHTE
jgi:hypothetical protein